MDMGQYEFVKNHLVLFRLCVTDRQKSLDALWGQLAASVLDYDVNGHFFEYFIRPGFHANND